MAIDDTVGKDPPQPQDGQDNAAKQQLIGGLFPPGQERNTACDVHEYRVACASPDLARRVVEMLGQYGHVIHAREFSALPCSLILRYKGEGPIFPMELMRTLASEISAIDPRAKAYALTRVSTAQTGQ